MSELWITDNKGGNYEIKLRKLLRNTFPPHGSPPPGVHIDVNFRHDSWCGLYSNEPCNCDPTIELNEIRTNASS